MFLPLFLEGFLSLRQKNLYFKCNHCVGLGDLVERRQLIGFPNKGSGSKLNNSNSKTFVDSLVNKPTRNSIICDASVANSSKNVMLTTDMYDKLVRLLNY